MNNEDLKFIFIVIITLLSVTATACAVHRKGLNKVWIFLTFFFTPLFLIVEILPNKNKKIPTIIQCPLCHKDISSEVKKCPYCGHKMPRTNNRFAIFYETLICIAWIFAIILMVIGIILSINGTLSEPLPITNYTQNDNNKSIMSQKKETNNIIINPLNMYVSNNQNSSYAPSLYIIYPNIIFNIRIVHQKLEFWISIDNQDTSPNFIYAQLSGQTIKFIHVKYALYKYKINETNTKDFLHNFTSSKSIILNINTQKIILSLVGSTKLFNDFINVVEEKHISLPPPFKYFDDSPLNSQNFSYLIKPNQQKVSNTSIQQALNTLNQVECTNIAQNLVNIVSSCYKNINNTNENIDMCLIEDELAGYWLSFTQSEKKLLQYNDFFSEKNFSLRKEQYMYSRFDSSLNAELYYDPFKKKENDLIDILKQRCTIN